MVKKFKKQAFFLLRDVASGRADGWPISGRVSVRVLQVYTSAGHRVSQTYTVRYIERTLARARSFR